MRKNKRIDYLNMRKKRKMDYRNRPMNKSQSNFKKVSKIIVILLINVVLSVMRGKQTVTFMEKKFI